MATNATVTSREISLNFLCGEQRLYGILHLPEHIGTVGILVITGRPALRVGRHRLFVMLARHWAATGIAVMRFDFRGTGDSEGEIGTINDTSADIASAVDAFISYAPGLQKVVLWGLCGGATDSIIYAPSDPRVIGLVLANPWSYDARLRGFAAVHRRLRRTSEWARSVAIRLNLPFPGVANRTKRHEASSGTNPAPAEGFDITMPRATVVVDRAYASYRDPGLSRRLADALEHFEGAVLFIFAGKDPGAQLFKRMTSMSPRWRRLLAGPRVACRDLPEANHSLRRPDWRGQAASWTAEWLRQHWG